MNRYNELIKLLKSKRINYKQLDIYDYQPGYCIGVDYIDKSGKKVSKYSHEYETIEAAAVELLEYFKKEY